ncbi:MAG TPA: DUF3617 family protein [Usitatibacter sp.]|nr:DUF3617 family protein [Usitatibacter sp.]
MSGFALRTMAAAAFAIALPALAQAPAAKPQAAAPAPAAGATSFKGKVKEGMYDVKSEYDMSNVPGVPKEQAKGSQTKQRCVTKSEIDKGVSAGKGCQIASAKESGSTTTVRMECQDGSVTEMKLVFSPGGYNSEVRTTGKQEGKAFSSVFRSQAKYVGPCPA